MLRDADMAPGPPPQHPCRNPRASARSPPAAGSLAPANGFSPARPVISAQSQRGDSVQVGRDDDCRDSPGAVRRPIRVARRRDSARSSRRRRRTCRRRTEDRAVHRRHGSIAGMPPPRDGAHRRLRFAGGDIHPPTDHVSASVPSPAPTSSRLRSPGVPSASRITGKVPAQRSAYEAAYASPTPAQSFIGCRSEPAETARRSRSPG